MHLIDWLRNKAPGFADDSYSRGRARATAGALRAYGRNELVAPLGFGPNPQVSA
jgi:hypothetical protein